ncbi:MAG: DUF2156 domain-containing protein [Vicinamibacteria bacterium]
MARVIGATRGGSCAGRELGLADVAALLHALVPFVVGLMGVLNALSALRPREPEVVQELERWLLPAVMQRSRALMLLAGVALLQVTRNLSRRKALAWWVAVGASPSRSSSTPDARSTSTTRWSPWPCSATSSPTAASFSAGPQRPRPCGARSSWRRCAVAAWSFGVVGLSDLGDQYRWDEGDTPAVEAVRAGLLTLDPGVDPHRPRRALLGALQLASRAGRLYVLVLLLRPVISRRRQEAPAEAVARLARGHGERSPSAFAAQEDKHHLLVADGRALVAPAVRGRVAPAVGDPLLRARRPRGGRPRVRGPLPEERLVPCVYEAPDASLPVYRRLGLGSLKMAEEALVDLDVVLARRREAAALRSMVHKVTRMGLVVSPYDRWRGRRAPRSTSSSRRSLEEWLAEKRLGEMGVTVSRFSLEALDDVHVFVGRDAAGRVVAFTSWRPYAGGRAAVLDLMRKRKDAPSGTMDLLVARSLESCAGGGSSRRASRTRRSRTSANCAAGSREGRRPPLREPQRGSGYKNLFQFKKKFAPRWSGRHPVFPARPPSFRRGRPSDEPPRRRRVGDRGGPSCPWARPAGEGAGARPAGGAPRTAAQRSSSPRSSPKRSAIR